MGFGQAISDLVKLQGITLKELSRRAGVPYTTVYSMVKRDSEGANTDTIKKIANALNVPVYVLTGWYVSEDGYYKFASDKKGDLHIPIDSQLLLRLKKSAERRNQSFGDRVEDILYWHCDDDDAIKWVSIENPPPQDPQDGNE